MIKLLFALIVMVSTVEAQTSDLENQIKALQAQIDSTRGDKHNGTVRFYTCCKQYKDNQQATRQRQF